MPSNILLIIADDLNAWIGALGRHPQVQTPHIDALAQRGDLFTHAYCSAPYCNASRMGLFTGRLPATLGIYVNEPLWDAPNRPKTSVELLREAGYHTYGAGKVFHGMFQYDVAGRDRAKHAPWREIENRDALWDRFETNTIEPLPAQRPLNGLFDFSQFDAVPPMYHHFDWGPLPDDAEAQMPDTKVAQSISAFLAAPPREPFLCAAGIYKPHLPWHAPKRFFDLYPRDTIALPLVKDDDLDDVPPLARQWALNPPDHALVTERGVWRDAVQGYLACVSYADFVIGQIIAALDRSPARDNTAVILCGDNGFHLGEKLHWRKFALWEEATRVPLIVVPPGDRDRANRIEEPVSLIDIFPTMLDFAGIAAPSHDGESLLSLAQKQAARARPVITTWGKDNHSLRNERWRYTTYADGGVELYDHAADGHEWTNLANTADHASVRQALGAAVEAHCGRAPRP